MREILFRGKCIDETCLKGQWLEGQILHDGVTGKYYIHRDNCLNESDNVGEEGLLRFVAYEVDPETVCQYTGLTDKNGRKIFEKDIIKIHQFLFDGGEYEKEIIVSIEYMDDRACFGANLLQAREIRQYMGYADEDLEKVVIPLSDFYGLHEESFEVIGNIFDNPELLEKPECSGCKCRRCFNKPECCTECNGAILGCEDYSETDIYDPEQLEGGEE